jgi:5-carboxymethyl-2-hydroxymuconate isomerase
MPHVIVEYSANLESMTSMPALIEAVHVAVLSTGVAPIDALRTRGEPRTVFRIGDGHPDLTFVAVLGRFGPGRTAEEKHRFLTDTLAAVESALGDAATNAMLSTEWQEIDAESRINRNHARVAITQRQATTP